MSVPVTNHNQSANVTNPLSDTIKGKNGKIEEKSQYQMLFRRQPVSREECYSWPPTALLRLRFCRGVQGITFYIGLDGFAQQQR